MKGGKNIVKDFVTTEPLILRNMTGVGEYQNMPTSFMDDPSGNKKNTMKVFCDQADLNKGLSRS